MSYTLEIRDSSLDGGGSGSYEVELDESENIKDALERHGAQFSYSSGLGAYLKELRGSAEKHVKEGVWAWVVEYYDSSNRRLNFEGFDKVGPNSKNSPEDGYKVVLEYKLIPNLKPRETDSVDDYKDSDGHIFESLAEKIKDLKTIYEEVPKIEDYVTTVEHFYGGATYELEAKKESKMDFDFNLPEEMPILNYKKVSSNMSLGSVEVYRVKMPVSQKQQDTVFIPEFDSDDAIIEFLDMLLTQARTEALLKALTPKETQEHVGAPVLIETQ